MLVTSLFIIVAMWKCYVDRLLSLTLR